MTEPFFDWAMEHRAEVRAAFDDYQLAEYEKASEACRGRLLNERGIRARKDALDLFQGNQTHAHAYASHELIEWWQTNPRPVFARFAQQYGEHA